MYSGEETDCTSLTYSILAVVRLSHEIEHRPVLTYGVGSLRCSDPPLPVELGQAVELDRVSAASARNPGL